MDGSKNRQGDHLGVNKMGKNIRKSPLHQPNFPNSSSSTSFSLPNRPQAQPQTQPQIYNISKNDFRSIVQQLTGSSSDSLPKPTNPPKPQSVRLQKIRPPPLSPMNRPHIPAPIQHPTPFLPAMVPVDTSSNTVQESPISAYMRILQSSIADPAYRGGDANPQPQPPPIAGQQPQVNPSSFQNTPPLLSPSSQFLVPSPTAFINLISPRSPYPLLSPAIQFPPPLTPNFSFSPFGSAPQAPPSPGFLFPVSPPGFFSYSPKWREP